ncbi:hydroxymethylbilane synthase [Maritalea myrionectae]|uniref:Porphobilinogen deaminase n=1 Tax=Maritalea myrionectae TaxID=454601 RepID=A0A2R4MAH3_9HYPH|nr:hydroxymethylbilane synthase [Maritalea myrionectae]AVX02955.1 hydroxymethylbilane synthase [Maritalea myrionectae]
MQTEPATKPILTIGTRGSLLALAQAKQVRRELAQKNGLNPDEIAIEVIKTSGDIILDRPLSEVGGKGLFTKEIEVALFDKRIDLAVHSAKDVATMLPDGMILPAFLEREDTRDAFVSLRHKSLDDVPQGAKFGTSSIRRGAQILRQRPDLQIVEFRGNVQTRMKKLEDGVAEATLLAYSGLKRLDMSHIAKQLIDPTIMPPAPGQGALAIETRADDDQVNEWVRKLNHAPTAAKMVAERHYLHGLDGSCRTPIAAYSTLENDELHIFGQVLSLDGQTVYEAEVSGHAADAEEIGKELASIIKSAAGDKFFETFEKRED